MLPHDGSLGLLVLIIPGGSLRLYVVIFQLGSLMSQRDDPLTRLACVWRVDWSIRLAHVRRGDPVTWLAFRNVVI